MRYRTLFPEDENAVELCEFGEDFINITKARVFA